MAACAEPPRKEMDQAQGAIDAARAAGADEYAAAELSAAAAALARAEEAVAQRDYRQALNQALDARERAQTAARDAANRKAEARSHAERDLRALRSLVETVRTWREAQRPRAVPAAALTTLDEALTAADTSLQEAGAAVEAQRFVEASTTLRVPTEQLRAAFAAAEQAASTAPAPRPTRRSR